MIKRNKQISLKKEEEKKTVVKKTTVEKIVPEKVSETILESIQVSLENKIEEIKKEPLHEAIKDVAKHYSRIAVNGDHPELKKFRAIIKMNGKAGMTAGGVVLEMITEWNKKNNNLNF